MEYGYLVIRANDQLEVRRQEAAELDNQKLWSDLNGYYEVVSRLLQNTEWSDVRILCDDEGLYKDLKPNKVASALYAGYSAIVGDVLIVRQGFRDDIGHDIFPFSEPDLTRVTKFFNGLLKTIKKANIDF